MISILGSSRLIAFFSPHLAWKGVISQKQVHSHSAEMWPHHSVFKGWISPPFKPVFIPYSDHNNVMNAEKAAVDTTGTYLGRVLRRALWKRFMQAISMASQEKSTW